MNMKHISSLLLGFCFLGLIGCSQKETIDAIPETKTPTLDFFSQYGDVHNAMLAYVDSNLDENLKLSKEQALDYLVGLQSEFANQLNLPESDKSLIKATLPVYKHLYDMENLCFDATRAKSDGIFVITADDIYASINDSFSRGEIDKFEKNMLTTLIRICSDNVNGRISNQAFEANFNSLVAQWESHFAKMDYSTLVDENGNFKNEQEQYPEGAVTGVILNISKSSLEYWAEPETRSVVATIVVQDVVGAVIGGVSGGVGSAVVGGHWNWGSVAWGAGVGAITGSTGVVGKVAKWIVSL